MLTAWDYAGNQLDQVTLTGAGTSFDSYFSLSYANGRIFIVDNAGQNWRGYDIGLSNVDVPEPASVALMALGMIGMRARRR